MKMDQIHFSEGHTAKSTAELSAEELINAIVDEVERLESDHFFDTTATSDSLLFSHRRCDSVYMDEMLVTVGPEFLAVELDAGHVIKPPRDCDNRLLSETNLDRGPNEEIIMCRNECGIEVEEGSQEMILKNYLDLKSQVNQQREMILDLQQRNLDLDSQVRKQQESILELKPLNTVNEFHQWNVQAWIYERLKSQNTQIYQELTTAELTDRVQIGIAEIDDAITTNERSLLTYSCQMDQLQDVKRHAVPIRNGKDDGKRTFVNLETIEESPKKARLRHSQSKIYSCAECKKQFNCRSNLTRHFRIHTGEKPYDCEDCGAAFNDLSTLRKHQRIHSGDKPYNCEECGAAFSQLGNLRVHQRIHSGEKPYNCKVCGAAFSHSNTFRRHQRIHSGEKPHGCEECGAAFSQLANLKVHQRIHSGEKPFDCEECGAAFTQSSSLKVHQQSHSDERPFVCEFCNKPFKRKENLSTHVMTVHIFDERSLQWQCNLCEKKFRFKSILVKHFQKCTRKG